MDMDSAAYFVSGSILVMLGFVVIAMGVVAINNIFAAYWQPVKLFTPDSWKGFHPPPVHYEQNEPPMFKEPDTGPVNVVTIKSTKDKVDPK
jgi:hypothetical protein